MAGSVGQPTQCWMPFVATKTNTNWATRTNDSAQLAMGRLVTDSTAQNNLFTVDIYMDSVTWKIPLVYGKDADQGTYNITGINGTQTVDGYAAAPSSNNYTEASSALAVATPGIKTLTVTMATKNASASGYGAKLNSIGVIAVSGSYSTPAGTDTPGYTWEWIPWMGAKGADAGWIRIQDPARFGGGSYSTSTDTEQTNTDAWSDAGTFKATVNYYKGPDKGILQVLLDTASQGTIDTYNATDIANNYSELTLLAVASAGIKNFKLKANGKNASSTNFWVIVHSFKWIRTGA